MLTLEAGCDGKKVVAQPVAAGFLVQTDLGRIDCTPPCARVVSGRHTQAQANCVYDERMSDGYIQGGSYIQWHKTAIFALLHKGKILCQSHLAA